MPAVIIGSDQDRLVDIDTQSARWHADVSQSGFSWVRGSGHMTTKPQQTN
jgi:hypothetical protein